MESLVKTSHPELENGNQRSDKSQTLDQKGVSPILKFEAEKREGENVPSLYYHTSVVMKNKIVLFGGEDSNYQKNNVLKIYDLEKCVWSQKELKGESHEIPKSAQYHTANAKGDSIFIISGYVEGVRMNANVYKIHFDTQKCQIIGEIVDPVTRHTADFHKQNIYVFGGYNYNTHKYQSMLQKFNLLTNECEVIKPIGYEPEGRRSHKSIIVSDNLYVFGGSTDNIHYQDLFSVDLSSYVSTKIDQHGLIPSPRGDFTFFAFEDQFYLFGGRSKDRYQQDFYAFDFKSKTWQLQETKNQKCLLKRAFHSTVVVKESSRKLKIYLVGGRESWNSIHKNMNVITLTSYRIYWVLHYLDSTGIHYLPGLNLVQEIFELFE